MASNLLNAARQLEVLSGVNATEVDVSTVRPSPTVGTSWTDSLEGTVGVATHHDGMSGTERQDVTDDYEQRISESHFEVEAGVGVALQKMLGLPPTEKLLHCNCNEQGNCLNMTICAATTGVATISVVAYNPLGQAASPWIRLPVTGADWEVSSETPDGSGKRACPSQTSPLDARTLSLPLLYLNSFGMNAAQIAAAEAELKNNASHVIEFRAPLPPMGYSTFTRKSTRNFHHTLISRGISDILLVSTVKRTTSATTSATTAIASKSSAAVTGAGSVNNSFYKIDYTASGISTITNLVSKESTPLDITWGWYRSSEGGCSGATDPATGKYSYDFYGCDSQASGAYMFRPNSSTVYPCGNSTPTLTVSTGLLVTEITQTYSSWCTHVLRLRKDDPAVEIEWTAGPIPLDQDWIPQPPVRFMLFLCCFMLFYALFMLFLCCFILFLCSFVLFLCCFVLFLCSFYALLCSFYAVFNAVLC